MGEAKRRFYTSVAFVLFYFIIFCQCPKTTPTSVLALGDVNCKAYCGKSAEKRCLWFKVCDREMFFFSSLPRRDERDFLDVAAFC